MSRSISRLLPLLLFCQLLPGQLDAQQPSRPPILGLGDAVVTGFSESIAPDPGKQRPANKSAIDLTFINPDAPSARVVNLGRPGYDWDGRLFQAPKTFDVFAKETGQLFGVALDDASAPNIYLAATSAFGLNLVGRGADGLPERRKAGGPGTGWMKGQFGLDLQGDPGSIYKVDGSTGAVTLFAKVMLDGVPNPGPALGNLTYDAAHKQLLVSDLYTGMIHRFAVADGSEPGAPYDHGVTGRGAVRLPPMPFNPANRPNIASNKFNAENPDSWGFAPPERRVWGLAVQAGRLFYSARNGATEGPQIWSVGIAQDGSLASDARLEVEVAAQPGPYPVSDIAFSQRGAMILAQRAPIAASYDYSAFAKPGEPRLLRYWLKEQGLSAPVQGAGDVTVAPQENAQTLDLFKAGDIAGAWVPEPWASRLVLEGGGTVLVDEKDLWPDGAFVTTHLIVSTEYLKKYPGTITKLLTAEADTLDAVTKDAAKAKESANAALLDLTGKQLKPEVLDRAWENLTLTLDPVASTLQVSADHGVEVGTTTKADLNGIYDLTLLNALLKARGGAAVSAAGLGTE